MQPAAKEYRGQENYMYMHTTLLYSKDIFM